MLEKVKREKNIRLKFLDVSETVIYKFKNEKIIDIT